MKQNDLNLSRDVQLGSWSGSSVRVEVVGLNLRPSGRAWLAHLDGVDIRHTFARTFIEPSVDDRDRGGRGRLVFEISDGRYEAQSAGIGRVVFGVRDHQVILTTVPKMLEVLRRRARVSYGEVRSLVASREYERARTLAMGLESPEERQSAYAMILMSSMDRKLRRTLPPLRGTATEIEWCEDLRAMALDALLEGIQSETPPAQSFIEEIAQELFSREDCRWWIKNRRQLKTWPAMFARFM